jgi:raffinose/stachyose/melibiose transport system substrate-binding protein
MNTRLRMLGVLAVLLAVLVACGPTATPQVVEKVVTKEVEVEKIVTQVVKETVIVEVEGTPQVVEKEVVVTATPEPEEVTIRVWAIMAGPEAEMLDRLSRNFEETHPNVTVEFVPYTFEDMTKVYALALGSGVGPDVSYVGSNESIPVGKNGLLVDLREAANKRGWPERISPWQAAEAENPFEDGGLYGVPWDLVSINAYYNKDLFAELGLEPPETFEEFETILATLKENGITPLAAGKGFNFDHQFYLLSHLTVPFEWLNKLRDLDPEADWTHPGFTQAMEILDSWVKKGYFNDDIFALTNDDARILFTSGQTGMMLGGTWNTAPILEEADFEVGFFPVPMIDESLPPQSVTTVNNVWTVSKSSPHPDVAIEYIDYLLGEEAARAIWANGGIPMYQFETLPEATSQLQREIYHAVQVSGSGFYIGTNETEVKDARRAALPLMVDGELTAAEVIQLIQDAHEAFMAELAEEE